MWNVSYTTVPCEDNWAGAGDQAALGSVPDIGSGGCCPTDPVVRTYFLFLFLLNGPLSNYTARHRLIQTQLARHPMLTRHRTLAIRTGLLAVAQGLGVLRPAG